MTERAVRVGDRIQHRRAHPCDAPYVVVKVVSNMIGSFADAQGNGHSRFVTLKNDHTLRSGWSIVPSEDAP